MKFLKSALRSLFLRLEQVCEKFFGPGLNPFVHLGSLGWFLFWIVTVTGIYIYVFFDTGVTWIASPPPLALTVMKAAVPSTVTSSGWSVALRVRLPNDE